MKNKKWTNKKVQPKTKRIYNTKKRKAIRKNKEYGVIAIVLGLAFVIILGYSNIDEGEINRNLNENSQNGITHALAMKNALKKQIDPLNDPELSVEQKVMYLVEREGLNPFEFYSLVKCESRWRIDAININTNRTYDLGLLQWNSIHKNISTECKLDPICATEKAIEKIKHDGGCQAWTCCNKLGLKL